MTTFDELPESLREWAEGAALVGAAVLRLVAVTPPADEPFVVGIMRELLDALAQYPDRSSAVEVTDVMTHIVAMGHPRQEWRARIRRRVLPPIAWGPQEWALWRDEVLEPIAKFDAEFGL